MSYWDKLPRSQRLVSPVVVGAGANLNVYLPPEARAYVTWITLAVQQYQGQVPPQGGYFIIGEYLNSAVWYGWIANAGTIHCTFDPPLFIDYTPPPPGGGPLPPVLPNSVLLINNSDFDVGVTLGGYILPKDFDVPRN